ncbi:MAG: TldD/PmbA family protein [Alphaproteobacteria bacterium]|nr:TldD/PmbA family protein [Alphaproteobacteria bacterium]
MAISNAHAYALDRLADLIAKARHAGADAADAVLVDSTSLSVAWRMGALERLERSESGDIGLRVFIGKRQAIVSASVSARDQGTRVRDELVERAIAMARAVPEDPFCGLADPGELAVELVDLDTCDPLEPSAETLVNRVRDAEGAALAVAGVTNSEGAEAGWSRSGVAVAASNGFAHAYDGSGVSLSASVIAGNGETGLERDYDYDTAVYFSELRPAEAIGHLAGTRAVARLGARKVMTQAVPVIYDQRVSRGLLSHLTSAINGAAIARGTSWLKDRMGQAVFAPGITVVEDPHRVRGLRSRPCDGEGVTNRRANLIEDGILTTWLLDLRSARQLGLHSNGHAVRGTSSPPSPAPSNVYLEAGSVSPEELIAGIQNGFFVTELFGMGINGITGDYSRGAAGLWIENGKLSYPVSEVTVAGNLKDMFKALVPANDLTFRHGIDCPTVRIDGMTVGGR